MCVRLRRYTQRDLQQVLRLFYDTVHTVCTGDYTEEQLRAWAPWPPDYDRWQRSLSAQYTIVAEQGGQLVGFGDLALPGYLDRLYVHRDFQRQGVATRLCDMLERRAKSPVIETHASITARPFFEKRGYTTWCEQRVCREGVILTNYAMRKPLF